MNQRLGLIGGPVIVRRFAFKAPRSESLSFCERRASSPPSHCTNVERSIGWPIAACALLL